MNKFEEIKTMNVDEFAKWLDDNFKAETPWIDWFDGKYCSHCEPVMGKYEDSDREIPFAYCEIYDECRYFEIPPGSLEIIKLWLSEDK